MSNAANELARYLMLNLTTDVKFNKELISISDTIYLTIPVEDALMNKIKDGFTFSSVEYTTEKYNFYLVMVLITVTLKCLMSFCVIIYPFLLGCYY